MSGESPDVDFPTADEDSQRSRSDNPTAVDETLGSLSIATTPSTFTHFPRLPYEIRAMIWQFALRVPRIVSVQSDTLTKTREPTPLLLTTCRESRTEGLKHYERIPIYKKVYHEDSNHILWTPIEFVGYSYINFHLDVIHFSRTTWADHPTEAGYPPPHLCSALDYTYNERIRRIVISNKLKARLTFFTDMLTLYKNVKEIVIVYDETGLDPSMFSKTDALLYFDMHIAPQLRYWRHSNLLNHNRRKLKFLSREELIVNLSMLDDYLLHAPS